MQKIIPHLWYDKEAKEAVHFYLSLFTQSKLRDMTVIENTPSGDVDLVSFELAGQMFTAISAGPYFKFNPSISLLAYCGTEDEVDTKWNVLADGGTVLVPLGEYPFSKRYGWIQDRYGLSWQLMLTDREAAEQRIVPSLLFSNGACGKAEAAIQYYTSIFANSRIRTISHYAEGEAQSTDAKVNFAEFSLEGFSLSAMDHRFGGEFNFNEAFSFMIYCDDQAEVDDYWEKLSAVPEAEECGWLKDKFGVSWQIVPANMDDMMYGGTEEQKNRVTEAFLKMKKLDIAALEAARLGDQSIEKG